MQEKPSNEVNNPQTTSSNYPIYEGYESTTPKGTRLWYDSLEYIRSMVFVCIVCCVVVVCVLQRKNGGVYILQGISFDLGAQVL